MYKKIVSHSLYQGLSSLGKKQKKLGLAPGSVVYTGDHVVSESTLFIADFGPEQVVHRTVKASEEIPPREAPNRWVQVSGLSDTAYIQSLGERYHIPALVLEDIVNPQHGSKFEEGDRFVFIIVKIPLLEDKTGALRFEQLSILLLDDLVLTFQETDMFHFEPLKRRLDNPSARMRQLGIDYLVYAMIDVVVDTYTYLGDIFREKMDAIEDDIMGETRKNLVEHIHQVKQMIAKTRKSARPLRTIVDAMVSGDVPRFSSELDPFVKDLKDHVNHLGDALESQREEAMMLMDSYLSLMSHRMNEVMKMLTIVSTIFIPLGFLAGVYGMNFDYIPELHFKYGYFVLLGIMAFGATSMFAFFRYKKWL